MTFADLGEAGRALAARLGPAPTGSLDLIAVVPGGVPVALEIADAWRCPVATIDLVRDGDVRPGPVPEVRDGYVHVVDDGVETGTAARVVGAALRAAGASRIVLAVPVCPRQAAASLALVYDEIVAIERPLGGRSLRWHYRDFAVPPREEALRRVAQHNASLG